MAYELDDKLVVGISTRALFDLDEAHRVFEQEGVEAYTRYQLDHVADVLPTGTGYPLVRGLLRINELAGEPLVEVVIISRNSAETGLRTRESIKALHLPIHRAAFTRGRPVYRYLDAFSCDLFLSAHDADVLGALQAGFPAAKILSVPPEAEEDEDEVRIAFDGDAVLFSGASEDLFQEHGLEAFQAHEAEKAEVPMEAGPFLGFLRALCAIQHRFGIDGCPLRTALITARDAISHERVVNTLQAMDVRIDEYFFLGGVRKQKVVKAFAPHIFFDDQLVHAEPASEVAPSAQVPRADKEPPVDEKQIRS
ncbi:MAG: 5'-nucleotidase [Planctomycetota bacterium]|nr:5'-nucleotidase [Planctomycetota bacterium]